MSIERIRDALAAGPTPGEWFAVNDGTRGEPFMNVKAERISGRGPTHEVAICATGDSPQSMETANARYIAACNPAAALLLALIAGLLGCGSADGDPANVVEKPVQVAQEQ